MSRGVGSVLIVSCHFNRPVNFFQFWEISSSVFFPWDSHYQGIGLAIVSSFLFSTYLYFEIFFERSLHFISYSIEFLFLTSYLQYTTAFFFGRCSGHVPHYSILSLFQSYNIFSYQNLIILLFSIFPTLSLFSPYCLFLFVGQLVLFCCLSFMLKLLVISACLLLLSACLLSWWHADWKFYTHGRACP